MCCQIHAASTAWRKQDAMREKIYEGKTVAKMDKLSQLISYFCEYDLYDNMLSAEVKDKAVKDILLKDCDYTYVSAKMAGRKAERIFQLIKARLDLKEFDKGKELIQEYLNHLISLEELFRKLPFQSANYLDQLKDQVNIIEKNSRFCVFYPVFLNHQKHTQQPLFTFSCECRDDILDIHKVYANKNILTLLIAQKKGLELSDARALFETHFDQMASAVDALHANEDFSDLYRVINGEFRKIFDMELKECTVSGDWQMLEKALVSFELPESVIDNCFRDELETMERFYRKDRILPDTVRQYLGLSEHKSQSVNEMDLNGYYFGSYQDQYSVNEKQWKLMQLAKTSKLLCIEGPPGTGKTTLLKEMIANELVKKAVSLLDIWDKPWSDMGDSGKEISCSPMSAENLHSIVISSTNNKAVDNIGVELLQEIPFFREFAERIQTDGAKYSGILCARLGRGDKIDEFYVSVLRPFCDFLELKTISEEDERKARDQFNELLEQLDNINLRTSEFLSYRSQFNGDSVESLEKRNCDLAEDLRQYSQKQERQEREQAELQKKLKKEEEKIDTAFRKSNNLKEQKEELEERLRILYSDLQEYETINGIKKYLIFLFPGVQELKKKYGSARQINDMITEEKIKKEGFDRQIELCNQDMEQAKRMRVKYFDKISTGKAEWLKTGSEKEEIEKRKELLDAYLGCISEMKKTFGESAESWISQSSFELRNRREVYVLRKRLFFAAVALFENYVILHKAPILKNLKILMSRNEREDGSAYYHWCRVLYNGDEPYSKDRARLVRMLWETFFLCFPVVTTTLHSFKKSTYQMVPDLIDMLLIDESGQIVPYYVAAPLYRARRAVFVGDVNQIEPIKNVPCHLLKKKYSEILGEECYSKFCLDRASVQSYAAEASDFHETAGGRTGGVILNQHRRCEPAIMAFSNQYVYNNVLELIGRDNNDKLFGSNLAAFDIRGRKAAEHYNVTELQACREIVRIFVEKYGENVKKRIGIITPFSMQAKKLKEYIPGVEVGTVHVFQGDEKEFIIFSCVVDSAKDAAGLYNFIGGKCNLLNVAFSRAKSQFIFVGNLQAAQSRENYLKQAAGVIKKYGKVFSFFDMEQVSDENCLADADVLRVLAGEQPPLPMDEIGRYLRKTIPLNIIDSPKLHNEILNTLLSMTARSIYIISPWISNNVVTEEMAETIRKKVGDGIFVQIMFGYRAVKCSLEDIEELVNRDSYWRKEEAVIAIRSLSEILGENLKYVPPSHIKLLLVDDSYLLIGSLNWLYNSGRSAQKEISCLITNPETIQYVKEGFLEERLLCSP